MTQENAQETVSQPLFSIVTPTFNRASLLPRLFESLCQQGDASMEWVIIDDGSTDETAATVTDMMSRSPFPVTYRYQPNGGKHRALNHALDVASGYFFVDIDSDDYFLPDVLNGYAELWYSLPNEQRHRLAGMVADCVHVDGRIVGRPFPQDGIVTNANDLRAKLKVRGDKLYMYKIAIARRFPSPEFDGENFLHESVRHRRIASEFDLLATTAAGRVKDYMDDGLSSESPGQMPNPLRNPKGYRLRTLEAVNFKAKENWRELLKECANYVRFAFHCGVPLSIQFSEVKNKPLLVLSLPVGAVRYARDRSYIRRHRSAV